MPCTGDAYFPSQMVVCSPSTGAPLTLWAWLKTAITWVSTQISPPQSGTLSLQSTVVYFYLFPPCPVIPILPACLIFFTEHITSSSDLVCAGTPPGPSHMQMPSRLRQGFAKGTANGKDRGKLESNLQSCSRCHKALKLRGMPRKAEVG